MFLLQNNKTPPAPGEDRTHNLRISKLQRTAYKYGTLTDIFMFNFSRKLYSGFSFSNFEFWIEDILTNLSSVVTNYSISKCSDLGPFEMMISQSGST